MPGGSAFSCARHLVLLLVFCTVGTGGLSAQLTTVYLNGLRPLRGELISLVKDRRLRLATFDGDTLLIDWEAIDHYQIRPRAKLNRYFNSDFPGYRRLRWFFVELSFGLVATRYGSGSRRYIFLEAHGLFTLGHRINSRQSLGFTSTITYNNGDEISLYADYQHRLGVRPSGLLLQLRAGYNFVTGVSRFGTAHGFAAYPSLGYLHRSPHQCNWLIDFGLRINQRKLRIGNDPISNTTSNRLVLRYGLRF